MRSIGLTAMIVTAGIAAGALVIGAAAPAPSGATLYTEHCAGCHENATGRTPTRALLAANPPGFILGALTTGIMAPMAKSLTAAQRYAIARYVSMVKETPTSFHDIDPKLITGNNKQRHLYFDIAFYFCRFQ